MRDIREYIHLYLGCEVKITSSSYHCVHEMDVHKDELRILLPSILTQVNSNNLTVLPILRQLSDMTEEEARDIWDSSMPNPGYKYNHRDRLLASCNRIEVIAPVIPKLLSKGFDLFNLIPDNLALDSKLLTTLKQ